MNLIRSNPVTQKDLTIANDIFEPIIGSLKGRTTMKKPERIQNNFINLPEE